MAAGRAPLLPRRRRPHRILSGGASPGTAEQRGWPAEGYSSLDATGHSNRGGMDVKIECWFGRAPRLAGGRKPGWSRQQRFSTNPQAAAPDWRYVFHNGRWWYWMPNSSWMYWDHGGWQNYAVARQAADSKPDPRRTRRFAGVPRIRRICQLEPAFHCEISHLFSWCYRSCGSRIGCGHSLLPGRRGLIMQSTN